MSKEVLASSKRNITLSAGTFNLCKSAVGAGILLLPSSMKTAGLVLGIVLLFTSSALCTTTLHFLARIAANTDMGDYFGVGKMAYGSVGEIVAVVVTLTYLFGCLLFYMSYSSKYLIEGLSAFFGNRDAWYYSKYCFIPLCAILIFPLASLRDLSKLAKASLVGMGCMTAVCALTVLDYFWDYKSIKPKYTLYVFGSQAICAFNTIIFAFCNHFTMLAIVPNFINPTAHRRAMLTGISSSVVLAFYLLTSIFGYLHFGNDIGDNILNASNKRIYSFAKILIGVVLLVSYPLVCDPSKACADLIVTKCIGKPSNSIAANTRNMLITTGFVVGTGVLAMFTGKVAEKVVAVFAALCGSLLMFIFPAAYFLKLGGDKYRISQVERISVYITLAAGVFVLIFGTIFSTMDLYSALMKSN